MQQEASRKLIPEYDTALSPYRDELARNLELSRSARLETTYNLEIPWNVDAARFNWEMRSISCGILQGVNPVYGSYQSGKISVEGGAAMIAAGLLIEQLQKRRGQRRSAYEKAQAEIDVFAEETASNLQACEGAYTLIMQLQAIYKELSRDTRQALCPVAAAISHRKATRRPFHSYYDFTLEERKFFGALYSAGEQLKQITALKA